MYLNLSRDDSSNKIYAGNRFLDIVLLTHEQKFLLVVSLRELIYSTLLTV